jgi:hypothetical protein
LEVQKQQCVTIKNCDKKNVICAAIPKPKVFAPMHHKKRIMKLENFSSDLSSPKKPGKKFVVSIETNSSVLQCTNR